MYLITVLVEESTDSTVSQLTRIVSLDHCIAILIVFLLQVIMTMTSSTVLPWVTEQEATKTLRPGLQSYAIHIS